MQELQIQKNRSSIAGGRCEELRSESKRVRFIRLDPFFGQCDYFSGALIDVMCPYAVHRAVLIVFIDCFYSCWKRQRVLAEDEVDLWKWPP